MTRDEILNMPAGYGMRKLLGEKVMGWNQQGKWWVGVASVICPVSVWKPDENIAAAWDVVEKLREQFHYRVYSDITKIGQCHTANFYNNAVGVGARQYYSASADTAPLAICRAALLAVMDNKNA